MYEVNHNDPLVDKAHNLVKIYFKDKEDLGGNQYSTHLYRVGYKIENNLRFSVDSVEEINKLYIIAVLHDIIEDTDVTLEFLEKEGFDQIIIEAIDVLTKRKHENYFDYIKRVKENKYSKIVKIYDLEDNMDITRLNKLDDIDFKRLKKYWKSYKYLTGEIENI